ncbi:MAG TPA: metallopeptidase family protein [Baekduia sp.]|uniref:metallopeptidase family protein n=1 Tax=Baekduia sp. TaxID=2600305 RepID=UPI002D0D49DD|nr:metallopeptidase family protein [Baekduia sp.]HMJ37074.1 metallopeptidase family protein [Baekduia sp.]
MSLRRTAFAAVLALSLGLTVIVLLDGGFSTIGWVRLFEMLGVVVMAGAALLGGMAVVGVRMAGWSEPESEEEFERVVLRAERLARDGTAAEPGETEFLDLDPYDDADFEELVRDAMDDLPDLLRAALDRNVAVVISDGGRRHGAYGLYQGDGATRDDYPDKIIIFRDTLRRDFGHDPDLLRHQVTVTVRHELAHHIGFDELGVRDLGL